MDNFTVIVLPQKTPPPKVEKKTVNYYFNILMENLKYYNALFLPYLNIFVVGRLIFYELSILFLQDYAVMQIVPILLLEIFVTFAIYQGQFVYKCFEPWGFFRYMTQQVTISMILFMALMGTDRMQIRTYGPATPPPSKIISQESVASDDNLFERVVVFGIAFTLLVELIEVFRNFSGAIKDAWVRGGLEGRKGLGRLFGSNESDSVWMELFFA